MFERVSCDHMNRRCKRTNERPTERKQARDSNKISIITSVKLFRRFMNQTENKSTHGRSKRKREKKKNRSSSVSLRITFCIYIHIHTGIESERTPNIHEITIVNVAETNVWATRVRFVCWIQLDVVVVVCALWAVSFAMAFHMYWNELLLLKYRQTETEFEATFAPLQLISRYLFSIVFHSIQKCCRWNRRFGTIFVIIIAAVVVVIVCCYKFFPCLFLFSSLSLSRPSLVWHLIF